MYEYNTWLTVQEEVERRKKNVASMMSNCGFYS